MKYKEGESKYSQIKKQFCTDYSQQNLSYAELAKKYGFSMSTVHFLVVKWGLKKTEQQRRQCISRRQTVVFIPEKELRHLYSEEHLSYREIAAKLHYSPSCIRKKCLLLGISKTKDQVLRDKLRNCSRRYKVISKSQLEALYCEQNLNMDQIADILKTHAVCVQKWVTYYGFKKTPEQNRARFLIERHLHQDIILQRRINRRCQKQHCSKEDARLVCDPSYYKEAVQNGRFQDMTNIEIAHALGVSYSYIQNRNRKLDLRKHILFSPKRSQEEKDIEVLLCTWGVSPRSVVTGKHLKNGREIDLFVPELSVGIEYNGSYWHSEEVVSRYYHQRMKSLPALKEHIFIFHIFGYEWFNPIVHIRIVSQLQRLIMSKKPVPQDYFCKIFKQCCPLSLRCFIEQNGNGILITNATAFISVVVTNVIIGAIAICLSSDGKQCWVLNYAQMPVYNDVMIWKILISKLYCLCPNIQDIEYISNLGHEDSRILKQIGFTQKMVIPPRPIWEKQEKETRICLSDESPRTIEEMHQNGFLRVYDAGRVLWTMNGPLEKREL